MIKTKSDACRVLGVRLSANESEIKTAYKALVKLYHPDSGLVSQTEKYNEVVEAYNFLRNGEAVQVKPAPVRSSVFRQTSTAKDYAKFERQIKKQKQEKAKAFEQKAKEYTKELERQEEQYKKAMEAIEAIRIARAIESMVWANGLEIPQGDRGQKHSD